MALKEEEMTITRTGADWGEASNYLSFQTARVLAGATEWVLEAMGNMRVTVEVENLPRDDKGLVLLGTVIANNLANLGEVIGSKLVDITGLRDALRAAAGMGALVGGELTISFRGGEMRTGSAFAALAKLLDLERNGPSGFIMPPGTRLKIVGPNDEEVGAFSLVISEITGGEISTSWVEE